MGALLFLSFFLALGLGTVLVAMRGGPRGVRDTLEAGRRKPMRATEFGLVALVIAFGLAVPAVILTSDQASAGPGGVKLSKSLTHGREVFHLKCSQCHQLKDAGAVGRVGPNLDELRPKPALTLDAIKNGRARGQGQMPIGIIDGEDAKDVANYVDKVAGR
jgi:cytochrome c5